MPTRLLGFLMVAGLLLAACGESGNDNPAIGGPPSSAGTSQASATSPAGGGGCPASAGLTANVALHGARAAAGARDKITAGDFFFDPTCLTAVPTGVVQLTISNTGGALHNFSLPGQGIDQDVGPGKQITVPVTVSTLALPYFCKYHRTSGMVGALLPAGNG